MAARMRHIQTRKGKFPRVRIAVPSRLQPIIGQTELVESLGTRDKAEIEQRYYGVVAQLKAKLDAAEAQLTPRPGFDVYIPSHVTTLPYGNIRVRLPPDAPGLMRTHGGVVILRDLAPGQEVVDVDGRLVARGRELIARSDPTPAFEAVPYETIIDLWALYRGKTSQITRKKTTAKIKRVFDFLGHSDMARVTPDDLNRYVEQKLLGRYIKALFRLAHKKGRVPTNPAADLEYNREIGSEKEPFTEAERRTILIAARSCTDPVVKWLHLLAGFHGARCAELCEAHVRDIQVEQGYPVFFIRLKNRQGDEKTLKTKDSNRWFPLHSAIRDEFMQYVASLPDGPLFPTLPVYDGRRNKTASNRANEFLRKTCRIEDPEKSFHSWRHTICSMLESADVPEARAEWMTGHAPVGVRRKVYLHRELPEVVAAFEKILDPTGDVQS